MFHNSDGCRSTEAHLKCYCHAPDARLMLAFQFIVKNYTLCNAAGSIRRRSFQIERMVHLELELSPF